MEKENKKIRKKAIEVISEKEKVIKALIVKLDKHNIEYEKLVKENSKLEHSLNIQLEENQEMKNYIRKLEQTIDVLTNREGLRPKSCI